MSFEQAGQRQRIFLVRAAASVAAHGNGEFAAGQDRNPLALGARLQRKLRVIGSDVARFAFEIGAEIDDRVTRVFRYLDRGVERSLRPRDQLELRAREGWIAGLAALVSCVVERMADGVVDRKAIFSDDGARIGERGRIRHRRSRCDRRRIVVRNVRDRQRHDLGALAGARQPAALDPRQMLANGVDLADRRAGAQQCPGYLLLLRE